MAASSEHGRIIADEAKAALAPLGFRRLGRSRVWLADHGHWVDAVEFQPSSYSKGSYCNVAAHWLWSLTPGLSFNYGFHRVGTFARFSDPESFVIEIANMARQAAVSAQRHRALFPSLAATADVLASDESVWSPAGGWKAFYAGVACGLVGDAERAQALLRHVQTSDNRDIDWVKARSSTVDELLAALSNPESFRSAVQVLVDAHRRALKLGPHSLPS